MEHTHTHSYTGRYLSGQAHVEMHSVLAMKLKGVLSQSFVAADCARASGGSQKRLEIMLTMCDSSACGRFSTANAKVLRWTQVVRIWQRASLRQNLSVEFAAVHAFRSPISHSAVAPGAWRHVQLRTLGRGGSGPGLSRFLIWVAAFSLRLSHRADAGCRCLPLCSNKVAGASTASEFSRCRGTEAHCRWGWAGQCHLVRLHMLPRHAQSLRLCTAFRRWRRTHAFRQ